MPISLILDVITAVLLVLTIVYAVRLNHRLSQLRSDKNELMQLAKTFADATIRAEAGIQQLRVSSEALSAEIAKGEALKDDLAYLLDRGSRTADEMVETVRPLKRKSSVRGSASKPTLGRGRSHQDDDEASLIEGAIRAATHGANEEKPRHEAFTQRITGRFGGAADKNTQDMAQSNQKAVAMHLATRGLGGDDFDSIENSDAARELLKALGSVK